MNIMRKTVSAAVICLLSFITPVCGALRANAYEMINAEIPVKCIRTAADDTSDYVIKIEAENEDSPMPVSDTLTLSETDTGNFEINVTEPGTFYYKIYELQGSDKNKEYDNGIYDITLFVEHDEKNELTYSVVASQADNGAKTDKIVFKDYVLSAELTRTTAVSVTTVTSTTTAVNTTAALTTSIRDEEKTITEFIGSVLTGDSFPAHTLRTAIIILLLTAISAFLFKRDQSEEEDKNEK